MHKAKIYNPYSAYFVLPALVLFGVFFILPNIAGMVLGFTDWNSYFPLSPRFNGLTNFKDMFDSSIFSISVKNTVYFTLVTTVVKMVLGFFLALLLTKAIRYKNLYRTIIFAPVVINPLVVALIFSSIYNPTYGILNAFLKFVGLGFLTRDWLVVAGTAMNAICAMEIWMAIGITMVIFIAGIHSVPNEYYEAAKIDGASKFRQLVHITLPLTMYCITINTILCLIRGTSVFGQVYGLTNGGPADATQVYYTFIFKQFSQNGLYGYSAAAGLLFTVVISIVSFLLLWVFRKLEVEY